MGCIINKIKENDFLKLTNNFGKYYLIFYIQASSPVCSVIAKSERPKAPWM